MHKEITEFRRENALHLCTFAALRENKN